MTEKNLLKRFQARARFLARAKRQPRFLQVVGKLRRAKLLDAPEVPEYGGPVELEDVLWAGTIEPRILEVLPALMLTRPKYLRCFEMPADLSSAISGLKKGTANESFRGVPASSYCKWLPNRGTGISTLKTFRMQRDDIDRLKRIRIRLQLKSDAAVLRKALKTLEETGR